MTDGEESIFDKKAKKQANKSEMSERKQMPTTKLCRYRKLGVPPVSGNSVEIGTLPSPIDGNKAQLIQNYLRLFLYITRHGVYIDGFAGPQDKENPQSWAAKLVLELTPPWMKSCLFV